MRIIEHFDNGCRFYPDNIAFIDVGGDQPGISYAQAQPVTQAIASAIHAHGYSEGGHVGVLAPNCTSAFLALLGLFRAQCVWLPINPRNTVPVNADLLSRFDGELLLFHSSYAAEAQQLLQQCPGIREIVCIDGDCGTGTSMAKWSEGAAQIPQYCAATAADIFAIFPTSAAGFTKPPCVGTCVIAISFVRGPIMSSNASTSIWPNSSEGTRSISNPRRRDCCKSAR